MTNDLISREALKKELNSRVFQDDYATTLLLSLFNNLIDNAPTVDTYTIEDIQEVRENSLILGAKLAQRPQGECKTCKHYKPYRNTWGDTRGDGYCSIKRMTQDGELEINVNDDFYCKYYEKGGAEND